MGQREGEVGRDERLAFARHAGSDLEHLMAEVAHVGAEDTDGFLERLAAGDFHQFARMVRERDRGEDGDVRAVGDIELAFHFRLEHLAQEEDGRRQASSLHAFISFIAIKF